MAAHVALLIGCSPGPRNFSSTSFQFFTGWPSTFTMTWRNDRWTDAFVSQGKVNIRPVAAVEFEDGPYRRAHLLALHVGGVTGNTQSQESNKGRDHASYRLARRVSLSSGTAPIISLAG